MAVIKNVVMRGASKQMGGVVFYTRSGETIARELAPAVSNPRTRPQMENRVKLGNIVGVYRANRAWMPGAFEDKAEKETDYNAFVRMNITNNAVALTKQHIAEGAAVAAPYRITSGSIQSVEYYRNQSGLISNLYTGGLVMTIATTIGQLSQALIQNNNNITEGMQLSLVINIQRRNENTQLPFIVTRVYEVVLNIESMELVNDYIPIEIFKTMETDGNPLMFDGATLGDGAAAFILSKTEAGRTRVSSQTMALFGSQTTYSIYTSAAAVRAAIESYGETVDNFLDSTGASRANNVVIDNFIQALGYNRNLYPAGSSVPTDLSSTYISVLYLSQKIEGPVNVEYEINNSGDRNQASQISLSSTGLSVAFQFSGSQAVSSATDVTVYLTYGETELEFSFVADPTIV